MAQNELKQAGTQRVVSNVELSCNRRHLAAVISLERRRLVCPLMATELGPYGDSRSQASNTFK